MTTRAGAAALNLRAKKELVRLLFSPPTKTPHIRKGGARLDHSQYSYHDLRAAYLDRVHSLHPDKQPCSGSKEQFLVLQETWNAYNKLAKPTGKTAACDAANFTMFGVGCSFSDNDIEREQRTKIMDQAGRGWFSSGELSAVTTNTGSTNASSTTSTGKPHISLLDHDLFEDSTVFSARDTNNATRSNATRPSLVSQFGARRKGR